MLSFLLSADGLGKFSYKPNAHSPPITAKNSINICRKELFRIAISFVW
jgi:hypothetical protein